MKNKQDMDPTAGSAAMRKAGRPKDTPSTAQMLEVARLFYKDGWTKLKIAKNQHIDNRKVTWLLDQAKDLGVVTISFHETRQSELEDQVRERFRHLRKVMVVPGPEIKTPEQYEAFLPRSASVAAD